MSVDTSIYSRCHENLKYFSTCVWQPMDLLRGLQRLRLQTLIDARRFLSWSATWRAKKFSKNPGNQNSRLQKGDIKQGPY